MAAKQKVEQVTKQMNTAGEFKGDFVWWTLADIEVNAEKFRATWKDAGLPESALPDDPTPLRALKLAANEVFGAAGSTGYLFRLAHKTDAGDIIYAVVKEHRKGDGTVEYHQEAKVMVDKAGKFASDHAEHAMVKPIGEAYARVHGCFAAREVRSTVIRALRSWGAVLLREAGGVYWVPAPASESVRALQKLTNGIGSSSFALVPIHGTPEGDAAIGDAARGSIEADLTALESEIAKWQADNTARKSTLEKRLVEYQSITDRVTLYRDLLTMRTDDLDAKLTALRTAAQTLLDTADVDDSKPAEPSPTETAQPTA